MFGKKLVLDHLLCEKHPDPNLQGLMFGYPILREYGRRWVLCVCPFPTTGEWTLLLRREVHRGSRVPVGVRATLPRPSHLQTRPGVTEDTRTLNHTLVHRHTSVQSPSPSRPQVPLRLLFSLQDPVPSSLRLLFVEPVPTPHNSATSSSVRTFPRTPRTVTGSGTGWDLSPTDTVWVRGGSVSGRS